MLESNLGGYSAVARSLASLFGKCFEDERSLCNTAQQDIQVARVVRRALGGLKLENSTPEGCTCEAEKSRLAQGGHPGAAHDNIEGVLTNVIMPSESPRCLNLLCAWLYVVGGAS